VVGVALLVFPELALGLSGFETGVAVMPLFIGDPRTPRRSPWDAFGCADHLLATAVTTLLISPVAFQPGGPANGRALAYLAHQYLGNAFGTSRGLSQGRPL